LKQLRLALLAVTALLVATLAPAQALTAAPAALASPAERSKQLSDLFHQYWEAYLKYSPETASAIGDDRYNDKISDYSVKSYNDWLAQEQNFLLQLAAIDPAGLSDQERLSRELLLRDLTTDQEASEFKEWEMPVTQMYGSIQTLYPQLVSQLSFNTVKDYDDWIARLHAIPHAFDQTMTNMSIGVDDHRVPPKYLLEKALDQVNEIAGQKPEDSPFALPLNKFPASISASDQQRIRTEMLSTISKEVLPAYVRFGLFLKATYIPAGRSDPGIWALPDGDKYYQFLIRRTTTTHLTADQIHQIGLEEVQKDEAAMLAIAQKLGFKDLASFRDSISANPKLKATSADQLMAAYKGYIDPMKAKLPELFGRLPKAPLEVVAMPDFVAKTAPPAYYDPGTPNGSRPGRLNVNLFKATDRNLYSVESVAYHEGVPGHHLQISIAQELTGIPEFRKYESYTAFVEGWALYAEQLGKDVGFYQNPYSDYGRLQADIWRAIRLVVDTGVHHDHWTRQQMVDFFHAHTAMDDTTTQAEVDRYIAWPSQALAYKMGQLKILELRARAQRALGDKFDIKAFHDEVVGSGALPLDVLDSRVDAWIAQQKAAQ